MKRIILLLFALIIGIISYAQNRAYASIHGYIYSFEGDTAIANALVKAKWQSKEYQDITDSIGYYLLDSVFVQGGGGEPLTYTLIASATGFLSDTVELLIGQGEELTQDFYLEKKYGSIKGKVTLDSDEWGVVEDVEIHLTGAGIDSLKHPNAEGEYEFLQLAVGEYEVKASLENYVPDSTEVNVEYDTVVVDFTLTPIPGKISGHIAIEPPGEVTDVIVTLDDTFDEVTPNEDGDYEFTSVPPGTYIVKALLDGYTSEPTSFERMIAPGQSIENLDFTMQPGSAKVRGYVRNEFDEAIDSANVIAGIEETFTNDEGYYEIVNLPIGAINIKAFADGYKESKYQDTILNPGENQIDFILKSIPQINVSIPKDSILQFEPTLIGGKSAILKFFVQGINIDSGIIISVREPFLISYNDTDFTDSLILKRTGYFTDTNVFVRFDPLNAAIYHDSVFLTSLGAVNAYVSLTGLGIEHLQAEIAASKDEICPGEQVFLEPLVSGGVEDTYTYEWWRSDTVFSTNPIVTVNPFVTTVYRLIVSDTINNIDSAFKTIEIISEPNILNDPDNDSVCANEEATFSIVLDNDQDVTYQWLEKADSIWLSISNDDMYSGAKTNELFIEGTNDSMNNYSYRCEFVRCNEPNYSDSAFLFVWRAPIDTIIIKGSPPVVLISPDSGSVYQWYRDDEILPGDTNQFYYPGAGFKPGSKYQVEIETEFGCTTITKPYIAPDVMKSISVYPNPVSNTLFVDATFLQFESELTVVLTDLAGKQLISKRLDRNNRKTNFSLNRLKQGIYLIRIIDDAGSNLYSSKIIKN